MRGKARWLLPLLAIPFLAVLALGLGRDRYVLPTPMIGSPSPEFTLETLAGGDSLGLAALEGKVVLLNFWASWCVPCRAEHDVLKMADRNWPESDVEVVGIVYQDSRANAQRFLDQLGGDWPQLMDPASRTAINFGVYGVPESYFLNRDGTIGYKQVGPVSWGLVESVVDSLLALPGTMTDAGTMSDAAVGEEAE
jgi:cytochrome c biogenesis protein CcmG/thiol:disulfide interchange protein DsbE